MYSIASIILHTHYINSQAVLVQMGVAHYINSQTVLVQMGVAHYIHSQTVLVQMGVDRCRMIVVAPSGPSCYGNGCQVLVACDQASFRNTIRYCARCWSNLCSSEAPSICTSLSLYLWPSAYYISPPFRRTLCYSLVCLFPPFCRALCTNC